MWEEILVLEKGYMWEEILVLEKGYMWEEILVLEKGYSLYARFEKNPYYLVAMTLPTEAAGGYYKRSAALAAKGF